MNYYNEDEYLAISGLQHFAFCERQWALIHVEQQWEENIRTAEGGVLHQRVHDPDYKEQRAGIVQIRGMRLSSAELGLYGVADMVEFIKQGDGAGIELPGRKGLYLPRPVEYKRGKSKVSNWDRLQVCAQSMCLEEMMGCRIEEAALFYGEPRRREQVILTDELRGEVRNVTARMHDIFYQGITPPPSVKLSVCRQCSMENVCQPRLRKKVSASYYWQRNMTELDTSTEEDQ